ncbi:MAG: GNAT family N-acetyltransferase [Pseudomonadota bacterium]
MIMAGDEPVGYSQVEDQGENLFIRMLLLLPEYQHRGLGTRLLNQVIELARARSSGVRLEVFKLNEKAKAFYEYHGFRDEGETPDSYVMALLPDER